MAPTIGSHALLLQLTTNLVHNAIVHNLSISTAWVTTTVQPKTVVLTVENTGEQLDRQVVSTLEPLLRGTRRTPRRARRRRPRPCQINSIVQAHDGTLTRPLGVDAGGLRVTVVAAPS